MHVHVKCRELSSPFRLEEIRSFVWRKAPFCEDRYERIYHSTGGKTIELRTSSYVHAKFGN